MSECVKLVKHDGGILQICLNRPEQLNALSRELLEQLAQQFQAAEQDASVRAILLTGNGKAFCAGADIKQLAALNSAQGLEYATFGQAVFRRLELMGKPSLAAIQGVALGGGCELAMAATLRIATMNASFGQPEVKLGLIPGFGGTQRLSRLIGKGRALAVCLTGRRITAEEAYQWGLINEMTGPDDLVSRALFILHECIQYGSVALKSIIEVIHQGYDLSLDKAFKLEAEYFGRCCETADKTEGVNAFLEKRTAVFSGK